MNNKMQRIKQPSAFFILTMPEQQNNYYIFKIYSTYQKYLRNVLTNIF